MANFKRGDKVRYEGDEYEVFSVIDNGHTVIMKDPKSGEEIRAQSFQVVPNAKFKVGDKVTDGEGVYKITDIDDGIYEWKLVSGRAVPGHAKGGMISWAEREMRAANANSCRNSVVANALAWKNSIGNLEDILRRNGISRAEFEKMQKEMKRKGASAIHYVRGKDGRLIFKADGTTIGNSTPSDGEVVENSDVGLLNTVLKALEQAKASVGRAYGNYTSKATDKTAVKKISAALDNVARSINDASQAIRASV